MFLLHDSHTYTKSDWEIWTSAIVTDTTLRNYLITSVKKYASDGQSSAPLGDWYDATSGAVEGFRARPVVGGHLALVRLLDRTERLRACVLTTYSCFHSW